MLELLLSSPIVGNQAPSGDYLLAASGTTTVGKTRETDFYDIASNSAMPGSRMAVGKSQFAGAGNREVAYFTGDSSAGSVSEKFLFASAVFAAYSNASLNNYSMAAASTPTTAYFAGGRNSANTYLSLVYRLTFADESLLGVGTLTPARFQAGGVGNVVCAFFAGGLTSSGTTGSVMRYNYADNSQTTSTALLARRLIASHGNAETAYFSGGMNTSSAAVGNTDKYAYSGTARVSGTALSPARHSAYGASVGNVGYIVGGATTATIDNVDTYQYSNDTIATAGHLTEPRTYHVTVSSAPGGF